jgi:signal transduction histidine kinase
MLRVGIQDTGSGLNPDIIPHLFKPYAISKVKKLKHVGMGLGLYLSKEVIETHGGIIDFDRNINSGSLFYFDLPMQLEPAPA